MLISYHHNLSKNHHKTLKKPIPMTAGMGFNGYGYKLPLNTPGLPAPIPTGLVWSFCLFRKDQGPDRSQNLKKNQDQNQSTVRPVFSGLVLVSVAAAAAEFDCQPSASRQASASQFKIAAANAGFIHLGKAYISCSGSLSFVF